MAKEEKYNVRVVKLNNSGQSFTGDDGKIYYSSSFAPAPVKDAMATLTEGSLIEITAAFSEKTQKLYINGLTVLQAAPVKANLDTSLPFGEDKKPDVVRPYREALEKQFTSELVEPAVSVAAVAPKILETAGDKKETIKPSPQTTQTPYVNPAVLKDERITRMACLNTATALLQALQANSSLPKQSIIESADSTLKLASVYERAVLQGFKLVIEEIKPQVEKSRAAAAEKEAAYAKDQKNREAAHRRSLGIAPSAEDGSSHVDDCNAAYGYGGRR